MTLNDLLFWAIVAIVTAPVWATLLWELWSMLVRPALVPRAEIDRLAAAMLAQHGDAAERMAFVEEDRAWRYSDSFEQRKWRRVRKAMRRRA
jgi:hypothetical protein